MTTTLEITTPERFGSNEAAQGARKARLAEIDRHYNGICADLDVERTAAIARSIAHSLERIRAITTGVEVDEDGRLVGHDLRKRIVARKLCLEALDINQERAGIEFRHALALDEVETARLAERNSFDFDVPLIVVPAQREEEAS